MISKKNSALKEFIYKIEYEFVKIAFKLFNIIGLRFAGFVCSLFATILGIFSPPSFLAFKNIKNAMPKLSNFEIIKIIVGMWKNLGGYIGEYCNVYDKQINIFDFVKLNDNSKKVLKEIKNSKQGAILFSGHIGNWEIGLRVLKELGIPVKTVYRPLNNHLVNEFTNNFRKQINVEMIAKGNKGAIKIAKELKAETKIVMLVDQRLSNGVVVPFFKQKAQTTDSVAIFALKYGIPIYPVRVIRKDMFGNFVFSVENKMKIVKGRNFQTDVKKITRQINQKLEQWIKEYPEQWFWVHDRWKK
jgi:Kdo2-lipid IVA lauroyltransferase/acyltransferase